MSVSDMKCMLRDHRPGPRLSSVTESAARSRSNQERMSCPQADTFFTILDGKLIVDTEGQNCASWGDVREQALRTAGECLRDMAANTLPIWSGNSSLQTRVMKPSCDCASL